MLNPILNKGGWGVSTSNADTVASLNPLLAEHVRLLHAYEAVRAALGPGPAADAIAERMPTLRADAGKISEMILSLGGTPRSGTDVEPGAIAVAGSPSEMMERLGEMETSYRDAIDRVVGTGNPQIRTASILGAVRGNVEARLAATAESARRLPS